MDTELSTLCEQVEIEATYLDAVPISAQKWQKDSFPWMVKLTFEGRNLSIPFYMGKGHAKRHWGRIATKHPQGQQYEDERNRGRWTEGWILTPTPPTASDVLESLLSDADFTTYCRDEFDLAEELGEPVTRESRATWDAIVRNTLDLHTLLGSSFDAFYRAER